MNTTPRGNGIGVHWGCSSTGISGYGNLVITSAGLTLEADTATAIDGAGYVVTDVTYNQRESATLEVWFSGSADTLNVTIASGSVPEPGDSITIADATATIYAGSNWIAGSTSITRVNNDLAKASTALRRYAKIS